MNDKRYYWLKLEENYFDLKIQKALRKLPSGADMLICYLKMQLKYMNKGGLIEHQGIYDNIAEEIALDIDEEIDLVKMTTSMLIKWNVIEQMDNSLYIAEMQNRVGSKTDSALRVAKHREKQKLLQCNTDVTKCNLIKDIEKDIDIELDKNNNIFDFIEESYGRGLTPIELEEIESWKQYHTEEEIKEAIKESCLNNVKKINYTKAILNNWRINGKEKVRQTPDWYGKDIEEDIATAEEIEELERMINHGCK